MPAYERAFATHHADPALKHASILILSVLLPPSLSPHILRATHACTKKRTNKMIQRAIQRRTSRPQRWAFLQRLKQAIAGAGNVAVSWSGLSTCGSCKHAVCASILYAYRPCLGCVGMSVQTVKSRSMVSRSGQSENHSQKGRQHAPTKIGTADSCTQHVNFDNSLKRAVKQAGRTCVRACVYGKGAKSARRDVMLCTLCVLMCQMRTPGFSFPRQH